MGFCTTMIVRLTSFTSSRLLITKSANLAIVLASDFHWYIVRPTKKQNQFCTCSSWTDMTRISADFCQHVWWLPLAFEWSYVPWCFTLSFQCQIMMIATANLRVLPVFECLLKTRGKKTFTRPTTYPSLLTLKVIINIILLHSRDILFFWRSLQRRWKFHTFICSFSFLHNKYLCVIEKSKKLNQQYTFILILKVCR